MDNFKEIRVIWMTIKDIKMLRNHQWYLYIKINLCLKDNFNQQQVIMIVIYQIHQWGKNLSILKESLKWVVNILKAILVTLKISLQEIKCLLLKSLDQNKIVSCLREDLKDKVHIIKIISKRLLKKVRVLNQEDNYR